MQNTWYAIKYSCHRKNYEHPRVHDNTEIQQSTSQDEHLKQSKEHIIKSWPENKDWITQHMKTYWIFWVDMAVIDWVILKSMYIVILETLQRQALEQLHVNHMGVEKTKLLLCQSIHWTGLNNDIENHIKLLYVSSFSVITANGKNNPPWCPKQPWEVAWADTFTLHNKNYICRLSH